MRISKEVLRKRIKKKSLVDEVIQTEGWNKIIKPELLKWRENEHRLAENEVDERKILKHCFTASSISRLLKFIENTLAEGERAIEQFKKMI